jgi:glycosyltransferase involved in cell wall biosynthesis
MAYMTASAETETSAPLRSASDAAAEPFVSVVIPHYNDLAALANCVRLLERQTYPRACFEIVVADNNSKCGLDAVRSAAPTAIVTLASEQGAGPARNVGISVSSGQIIALIDSDCQPDSQWLRRGVEALGGFDFIGGTVIATSRDPQRPNPVEAFEMVFAFDFKRYIEKVGFTGTGNMFVSRRVFDAVGGFRSGVAEDMEWSFRARAKGYSLGYASRAVVRHPARVEWRDLQARWSRMLEEEHLLACEQPFGRLKWAAMTLLMPASIVPHAWRVLRSDRLPRFKDKLGAISVLAKLRIWRTGEMSRLLLGGVSRR